ncbi:hypothetical protein H5410_043179 [Solanum commersonii]|uniref:Uncharacterized protein n=1 Tax=Solanum commersonii TaxID=4109 RepID=A0A9J5XWU5_SOLCO|nr:hypothetical protein H5410_043179 [Solanum commersonii]
MVDMRRIGCEIEFFKWFKMTGTIIKASPFKEKSDKSAIFVTSADIDRVVEQNNYSNQILHVISRQIKDTKPTISRRPTPASTSSNLLRLILKDLRLKESFNSPMVP